MPRNPAPRAIGLVTIGQAPRDDMVPEMLPAWPGVDVRQGGALDDLTDHEIRALPASGDEVLTSRLRSGGSAIFTRNAILPGVQRRIDELEAAGVTATLLVCTGSFPRLRHRRPLLAAEPLLVAAVGGLAAGGRLGVICPLADQQQGTKIKFAAAGASGICTAVADPYHDDPERFRSVAEELVRAGADMVVLDCMGYTEEQRGWITAAVEVPVILARTAVARLFAELIAGTAGVGELLSDQGME